MYNLLNEAMAGIELHITPMAASTKLLLTSKSAGSLQNYFRLEGDDRPAEGYDKCCITDISVLKESDAIE